MSPDTPAPSLPNAPGEPRRRGRRRLGEEPALNRDRLVQVLLRVARAEGLAAINMRRVAAELNVSPRLLYHHVRDKDELVDLLSDAIIARNMPDLSSPDWETRLRNVAAASARAYADFPGVPASILARTVNRLRQPNALKLREAILQALRDSGLSEENVEISFLQFSVILLGSLVLKENLTHPEAGGGFAIDPARVERSIAMGLDLLVFGIRRLTQGGTG